MIELHRLRGESFLLNPDLIESVEATPDTVITLVDGRKTVVAEAPVTIIDLVVCFRAAVISAAEAARTGSSPGRPVLTVFDGAEE